MAHDRNLVDSIGERFATPVGLERGANDVHVSAVVICDQRRSFVTRALRSALGQGDGARPLEAIVIKSFEDTSLERSLRDLGATVVHTDAKAVGPKLALGIRLARGDVVAFLEDDDAWAESKLRGVRAAFTRDPGLGFYHNDFRLWPAREADAPLPPGLWREPDAPMPRPSLLTPSRLRRGDAARMLATGALFNASSIAVRRTLATAYLDLIRGTVSAPELSLFLPSVLTDSPICLDPMALTAYRIHPHRSSAVSAVGVNETLAQVHRRAVVALPELIAREGAAPFPAVRRLLGFYAFSCAAQELVSSGSRHRLSAIRLLRRRYRELALVDTMRSWAFGEVALLVRFLIRPGWAQRTLVGKVRAFDSPTVWLALDPR